jgi:hypothetical protein
MLVSVAIADDESARAIFDVDESDVESEVTLAASPGETAARVTGTLRDALDEVMPVVGEVASRFERLRADEVSIDFGLKVGGELGLIVTKGSVEANFAIHVLWRAKEERHAG